MFAGSALVGAAGLTLLGAPVATRFGIFAGGVASARDPKYTVLPQRARAAPQGPTSADDEGGAVGAGGQQLADDRVAGDLGGDE